MLRTIKQSGLLRPLAILACTAALLSFSYRLGGDHFTISINGTKLIEQHVAMKSPAKVIYIDKYNAVMSTADRDVHTLFKTVPGPIESWEQLP